MSGRIKAINPEIIVKGCADKPYYQIKYYDKEDNLYHYGFGSYDYGTVLLWLREYFEPIQAEEQPVNHGILHNIQELLGVICGDVRTATKSHTIRREEIGKSE